LSHDLPGEFVAVWPYFGHLGPSAPALIRMSGTSLGRRSFGDLIPDVVFVKTVRGKLETYRPPAEGWPRVAQMVEYVLYLGARDVKVPASAREYDAAYAAELRRRAKILDNVFGPGFDDQLETQLATPQVTTPHRPSGPRGSGP
jgi:hypothetical protein